MGTLHDKWPCWSKASKQLCLPGLAKNGVSAQKSFEAMQTVGTHKLSRSPTFFKTDVTKRCGKFQTKIDIQASRKLQPSARSGSQSSHQVELSSRKVARNCLRPTYASLTRPQCQLTGGDSSILLTRQLTLT